MDTTTETTPLRAVALVCTLSPSPKRSSSQLLAEQATAWPEIRDTIMGCDILVLSTPIWLGHPSSLAQRVLERLDAELGESDDEGRMLTYGKAAAVCVVGNEDGAHHVSAELFQALNDVGFSLAPNAVTYWVGEAMQGTDYQDLDKTPRQDRGHDQDPGREHRAPGAPPQGLPVPVLHVIPVNLPEGGREALPRAPSRPGPLPPPSG